MRILAAALLLALPVAAQPADEGASRLAALRAHYDALPSAADQVAVPLAPNAPAATPGDALVAQTHGGAVLGMAVGPLVGAAAGVAVGFLIPSDDTYFHEGALIGGVAGMLAGAIAGTAYGAHLGNQRQGDLWRTFGGALTPAALGTLVAAGLIRAGQDNLAAGAVVGGLALAIPLAARAELESTPGW